MSGLYAVLADRGFFPAEWLETYNRDGGRLAEQPSPGCVPGLEVATGSLGHGLSIGLGMALAGISGALFARIGGPGWSPWQRAWVLALVAVIVTAVYDLATNVATGLVFGQMRVVLLAGIPFSLWHIGFNVALFAILGTPLAAVLARYAERLEA